MVDVKICKTLVTLLPLRTDVPYTHSPDDHDFDLVGFPGKTSPVGHFMVADNLPSAVSTSIGLFTSALVPVSGYGGT